MKAKRELFTLSQTDLFKILKKVNFYHIKKESERSADYIPEENRRFDFNELIRRIKNKQNRNNEREKENKPRTNKNYKEDTNNSGDNYTNIDYKEEEYESSNFREKNKIRITGDYINIRDDEQNDQNINHINEDLKSNTNVLVGNFIIPENNILNDIINTTSSSILSRQEEQLLEASEMHIFIERYKQKIHTVLYPITDNNLNTNDNMSGKVKFKIKNGNILEVIILISAIFISFDQFKQLILNFCKKYSDNYKYLDLDEEFIYEKLFFILASKVKLSKFMGGGLKDFFEKTLFFKIKNQANSKMNRKKKKNNKNIDFKKSKKSDYSDIDGSISEEYSSMSNTINNKENKSIKINDKSYTVKEFLDVSKVHNLSVEDENKFKNINKRITNSLINLGNFAKNQVDVDEEKSKKEKEIIDKINQDNKNKFLKKNTNIKRDLKRDSITNLISGIMEMKIDNYSNSQNSNSNNKQSNYNKISDFGNMYINSHKKPDFYNVSKFTTLFSNDNDNLKAELRHKQISNFNSFHNLKIDLNQINISKKLGLLRDSNRAKNKKATISTELKNFENKENSIFNEGKNWNNRVKDYLKIEREELKSKFIEQKKIIERMKSKNDISYNDNSCYSNQGDKENKNKNSKYQEFKEANQEVEELYSNRNKNKFEFSENQCNKSLRASIQGNNDKNSKIKSINNINFCFQFEGESILCRPDYRYSKFTNKDYAIYYDKISKTGNYYIMSKLEPPDSFALSLLRNKSVRPSVLVEEHRKRNIRLTHLSLEQRTSRAARSNISLNFKHSFYKFNEMYFPDIDYSTYDELTTGSIYRWIYYKFENEYKAFQLIGVRKFLSNIRDIHNIKDEEFRNMVDFNPDSDENSDTVGYSSNDQCNSLNKLVNEDNSNSEEIESLRRIKNINLVYSKKHKSNHNKKNSIIKLTRNESSNEANFINSIKLSSNEFNLKYNYVYDEEYQRTLKKQYKQQEKIKSSNKEGNSPDSKIKLITNDKIELLSQQKKISNINIDRSTSSSRNLNKTNSIINSARSTFNLNSDHYQKHVQQRTSLVNEKKMHSQKKKINKDEDYFLFFKKDSFLAELNFTLIEESIKELLVYERSAKLKRILDTELFKTIGRIFTEKYILPRVKTRKVKCGERVITQNDNNSRLFVIAKGEFSVKTKMSIFEMTKLIFLLVIELKYREQVRNSKSKIIEVMQEEMRKKKLKDIMKYTEKLKANKDKRISMISQRNKSVITSPTNIDKTSYRKSVFKENNRTSFDMDINKVDDENEANIKTKSTISKYKSKEEEDEYNKLIKHAKNKSYITFVPKNYNKQKNNAIKKDKEKNNLDKRPEFHVSSKLIYQSGDVTKRNQEGVDAFKANLEKEKFAKHNQVFSKAIEELSSIFKEPDGNHDINENSSLENQQQTKSITNYILSGINYLIKEPDLQEHNFENYFKKMSTLYQDLFPHAQKHNSFDLFKLGSNDILGLNVISTNEDEDNKKQQNANINTNNSNIRNNSNRNINSNIEDQFNHKFLDKFYSNSKKSIFTYTCESLEGGYLYELSRDDIEEIPNEAVYYITKSTINQKEEIQSKKILDRLIQIKKELMRIINNKYNIIPYCDTTLAEKINDVKLNIKVISNDYELDNNEYQTIVRYRKMKEEEELSKENAFISKYNAVNPNSINNKKLNDEDKDCIEFFDYNPLINFSFIDKNEVNEKIRRKIIIKKQKKAEEDKIFSRYNSIIKEQLSVNKMLEKKIEANEEYCKGLLKNCDRLSLATISHDKLLNIQSINKETISSINNQKEINNIIDNSGDYISMNINTKDNRVDNIEMNDNKVVLLSKSNFNSPNNKNYYNMKKETNEFNSSRYKKYLMNNSTIKFKHNARLSKIAKSSDKLAVNEKKNINIVNNDTSNIGGKQNNDISQIHKSSKINHIENEITFKDDDISNSHNTSKERLHPNDKNPYINKSSSMKVENKDSNKEDFPNYTKLDNKLTRNKVKKPTLDSSLNISNKFNNKFIKMSIDKSNNIKNAYLSKSIILPKLNFNNIELKSNDLASNNIAKDYYKDINMEDNLINFRRKLLNYNNSKIRDMLYKEDRENNNNKNKSVLMKTKQLNGISINYKSNYISTIEDKLLVTGNKFILDKGDY